MWLAVVLITAVGLIAAAVITVTRYVLDRHAGVRRKVLYLALSTLEAIDQETDRYHTVEPQLAAAVRAHIRRHQRLQVAMRTGTPPPPPAPPGPGQG